MKNKGYRLNNIFFPIWFLLIFPMSWLVVLPVNFIIDSLVVIIALKCLKQSGIKRLYKKSILKVWLFGFISDFAGVGVLLSAMFIDNTWWSDNVLDVVYQNPFTGIFGFLFVLLAVAVSSVCIYFLNYNFSFKKLGLEKSAKIKLSLSLAVFTAPVAFFIPTTWIYGL